MKKLKILKGIVFPVIPVVISFMVYSCGGEKDNSEVVISGTPVTITHPYLTGISDYIELNGSTVFLTKEIIRATFQGFVEKVFKNIGDNIKPGDDLFQMKTIESAATDSLNISLGNKQFKGYVILKARSDGVLTELNYHQGDFVSNGELLAVVSNPSSMRIKVNVPFEDVSKVKIGNNCEIQLPGGEKLKGIIDRKIPRVDSATQTQIYFLKLDNYKQLPENLNVAVRIPFQRIKDALVIPKNSISTNVTQDSFWVMKLVNDTTAVRVNVQKGIENDSLVQLVNTSLKPDDRVILTGHYGLPDTVKVEIQK
jgi:multidrug efflux pump subunit AcrA (membrane-fusion protein)